MKTSFPLEDMQFEIDDNRERLDIEMIHAYLSGRSYWAQGRPMETVVRSIQNSICLGVYQEGEQIGFARVVTDRATFAWVCDVFILERWCGKGLGKVLVKSIVAHPELQGLKRMMLATRDAHELYQEYAGFEPLSSPERWMERGHK